MLIQHQPESHLRSRTSFPLQRPHYCRLLCRLAQCCSPLSEGGAVYSTRSRGIVRQISPGENKPSSGLFTSHEAARAIDDPWFRSCPHTFVERGEVCGVLVREAGDGSSN
jgi:hypothetical protein